MAATGPFKLKPVAELKGHDDKAWAVAWNPAKPLLASCSTDKTVRLYSYTKNPSDDENRTAAFQHVHTIDTAHTRTVRSIAWSPSGRVLATASFDSTLGIWEQELDEDGQPIGEWETTGQLEGHESECKAVAYSSSGTLLATCGRDKAVWIWEVGPDSDFECVAVLMDHSQDVKCLAWHPTHEILASGSFDDTIRIYEDDPDDDWFCSTVLEGHGSTIWSLAWSPDGMYLASASADLSIRIWQRKSMREVDCVAVIDGAHERCIYGISWRGLDAGSLGLIASASEDGAIRVWKISKPDDSPRLSHELVAQVQSAHGVFDVNSIAWCPRDKFQNLLATTGDDGMVRVWEMAST